MGEPVDPRRFRANFLIDTDSTGYIEDDWVDSQIQIGANVGFKGCCSASKMRNVEQCSRRVTRGCSDTPYVS